MVAGHNYISHNDAGLGGGIQNVYIDMQRKEWPNVDIMVPIYITQ
jgi:hypothetical protein